MNETIEQVGTAVAIRDDAPGASPALFQTDDPVEVVQKAVRVADALKAVVVQKNLISNIQGKAYPQVEAWLTLAAMLRLTTICEWTRRVEDGWEARVYVRDASGNTVGAAEAQCLSTERSKKSWEDYALRSMAQTRATSKSLRSVLGFIMTLAGYEATPSEEMPGNTAQPASQKTAPRASMARKAYEAWLTHCGVADTPDSEAKFRAWATGLTPSQVIEKLQRAANPDGVVDSSAQEASLDDVLLTPGGDLHKALMAAHGRWNHSDSERHALYKSKFGVTSSKNLTRQMARILLKHLESAA